MKYNLFAIFLFIPTFLIGQANDILERSNPIANNSNIVLTTNSEEIDGNQFYKDKWVPGKVIMPNSKTTESILMNYNSYTDQLVFVQNDVYKVFDPKYIKGFMFIDGEGNAEEVFVTGEKNKKYDIKESTPLRVIYNGDVKLFARHVTKFRNSGTRDPFGNKASKEYKEQVYYFLKLEDGSYKRVKLSTKDVIKHLGEKKDNLKDFTKEKNIKGRNEQEIFWLLEHFDSLD